MASNRVAVRSRYSYGNQNSRANNRTNAQMYVYGNVVPKPDYDPVRRAREPERRTSGKNTRRNQKRRTALHMSRRYVAFLAVASVAALIICINYVSMQSRITSRSKHISTLQAELASLKEENNTKYNSVMDSVNLEEVRERAINELHMTYAAPNQVVGYKKVSDDYVKQYENIPKDGVLAQSDRE